MGLGNDPTGRKCGTEMETSVHTLCECEVLASLRHIYLDIILNSARQHNHFITQGNYRATCFDYRLVILRPTLSIVSQDAMHTLGSAIV